MTLPNQWSRGRRWIKAFLICVLLAAGYFGVICYQVWRQAHLDEARKADVIVVLGAAQYWGRPSPVLRARLDHAPRPLPAGPRAAHHHHRRLWHGRRVHRE